jgi:hypothetical protein
LTSVATYHLAEDIDLLDELTVPGDFPLSNQGAIRAGPLVGGGVELGLGDGYTVAAKALIGPLFEHPISGGNDQARFNADVEVAVGKRFF